ncbi:MAG: nitrate oxidoreductase subunit alpha, partial [Acidimicrobiia bacterium]|nr:nitrate oxidoreductase subunit alpha [Acidimicrobiia bacterium]
KSRHSVHSSWAVTDWHWIYASYFSDPYREDKRLPGVGDAQLHMNPEDAQALGIDDGDYVWVDANSDDRPYVGVDKNPKYLEVSRLLCRLTYNRSYPRGVTMLKHAFWMSTTKTVRATKERADGKALADTGYQSSFRTGSQQSITRGWAPPMHQTDSLFHKLAGRMGYVFGFDVDNHAINTVPKETLVKVTRAEAGGLDGRPWSPGTGGRTPGNENAAMDKYLSGGYVNGGG